MCNTSLLAFPCRLPHPLQPLQIGMIAFQERSLIRAQCTHLFGELHAAHAGGAEFYARLQCSILNAGGNPPRSSAASSTG